MLDFELLNAEYTVEYRKNAVCSPLYISKRGTFEEKPESRCVSFESAMELAQENNLVFSAEDSAFKSSYRIAEELNSSMGKVAAIPRMIYFSAMESKKPVPQEAFKNISEEQLKNWYESLLD